MNRQSDFGYAIGDQEVRTVELCRHRANLCERDGKLEWAQIWRDEAKEIAARQGVDLTGKL